MTYQNYLKKIYYNPEHPASFSGLEKLYRAVRKDGKYVLGRTKIKAWLIKQEPFTLHRAVIRKQTRQKIIAPYIDYQWDIDTAYMTTYSKENVWYSYFLLIIDVFSKFVWTFPLRNVRGSEVVMSFQSVLDQGRRPDKVRTDMGSEFKSKVFQNLLKKEGIDHFYSYNETKSAVAERAIKTIKSKLARYMTKNQTHRWIDILEVMTKSYNHTFHRSLKKAPINVKPEDQAIIWQMHYDPIPKKKYHKTSSIPTKFSFKIGDKVRISHLRRAFQREYDERWTMEYFIVSERGIKQGIPFYRLQDLEGDDIKGKFYANEISKILIDKTTSFRIEKIMQRTKNKVLVKWMGWPAKFNSWIPLKDLKKFSEKS